MQRCLTQCHLYRGWTAAFIAHMLKNGLDEGFNGRVGHWHVEYLRRIQGKANDARIASNHACLAAALQLFAGFMKEVWPEADEAAADFAEEYLAELVVEAAGAVEEETPARIFLDTLSDLIAFGRVRIEGIGALIKSDDSRERDKIVGRVISGPKPYQDLAQLPDSTIIGLSAQLAMKAVQEQLAAKGGSRSRSGYEP